MVNSAACRWYPSLRRGAAHSPRRAPAERADHERPDLRANRAAEAALLTGSRRASSAHLAQGALRSVMTCPFYGRGGEGGSDALTGGAAHLQLGLAIRRATGAMTTPAVESGRWQVPGRNPAFKRSDRVPRCSQRRSGQVVLPDLVMRALTRDVGSPEVGRKSRRRPSTVAAPRVTRTRSEEADGLRCESRRVRVVGGGYEASRGSVRR